MLPADRPWRSWAALVTALVLHCVAGGATYRLGHTIARPIEVPAAVATETEIELDDGAPVPRSSESTQPIDPLIDIEALSQKSRERPAQLSRFASPKPSMTPESASDVDPEKKNETAYALDPSAATDRAGEGGRGGGRGADLGISPGSWSLWVDPTGRADSPPPQPGRPSAPASRTGGLAEALEAHDQELGLGPAGPVLSAALEAGHSDIAPAIGNATFTVTVFKTGWIQVDLTGASSNVDGWRQVADQMAAAIKRKPPRIDGGRSGVRIGLKLVAEERLPAPVGKRFSAEGGSLVFRGDLSNIGAPVQRFVSAQVTTQAMF
jgi:hypothetical protein